MVTIMKPRRRTLCQVLTLSLFALLFHLFISKKTRNEESHSHVMPSPSPKLQTGYRNNLHLDEHQCNQAFPGLNYEIELAIEKGPFDLPWTINAALQAKIENDQVGMPPLWPILCD